MSTHAIPEQLETLLVELERRRLALIGRLSQYPSRQLRTKPSPRSWSLLDIAEHLLLTERVALAAIKSQPAGRLRRRWHHRPLGRLITRVLESSLRVPITGRSLTPAGRTGLAEIAEAWRDVHEAWRAYLEGIPPDRRSELVFRHPIGVPMTAAETLVMLGRHFDHHLHQVARVERSAGLVAGVGASPRRETA